MRRRLTALAIGLGVFVHAVLAQAPGNYPALVRMYAAGRGNDAIAALLRWPHGEAIGAAKTAATTLTPREMIPAAILHTEAALSLVDARPFAAIAHIQAAQTLLRTAAQDASTRERANTAAARWYYFVASLLTSAKQMEQAAWYVREGFAAFPRNAALYLVRGTIAEVSIQAGSRRDLSDLPMNSRERARVEALARRATDDYLRALSVDNHLALAHLHIGWLRLILGDNRARSELEAAAADAATSRIRYLAHLFLGAVAERGKRLEDARREYAEALAAGPGFQSAYMALSRAEEALATAAAPRSWPNNAHSSRRTTIRGGISWSASIARRWRSCAWRRGVSEDRQSAGGALADAAASVAGAADVSE